ncbi:MAG TPA: AbrB/MazE/SpoVT family DNA-binding domain-containing protein [Chloroflexota bacterium]|nr:AbrB/MazE/SpoVT family DNA-binding domain-containing protein [Chloroflexota bacterium]
MAHTFEAQIGARGRIVLPAELRARHRWRQGERLRLIEDEDGTVHVMSVEEALERAKGLYAHLKPPGVSVVDEFLAERRAEATAE